ncbi:hypothetical protein LPC08_17255 [Roseomonas sp. OT10]|uniref:hypothetical protein n=1 Tax=Roseomonas cutis TaxID=2897332 RepID=UPI001E4DCB86|nr:hypothetical protein [Roseomonas sp. OT10]UFN47751.1 hypothetical protein LPC08_17255 [Roseomonas sp. OT10]
MLLALAAAALPLSPALARVVVTGDAGFVAESAGVLPAPFLYLGAKQVLTDPAAWLLLLALLLLPWRDVAGRAALLALGAIVALGWPGAPGPGSEAGAALLGAALAWLALDNLGAWRRWLGWRHSGRLAALVARGALGVAAAAALAALPLSPQGALANALSFRLGAGLGLALALLACARVLRGWRRPGGPLDPARPDAGHAGPAYPANVALLALGFVLAGRGLAALLIA